MEIAREHFLKIAESAIEEAGDIFYDNDENIGESDPKKTMKSAIVEQMESYFKNILGFTIV